MTNHPSTCKSCGTPLQGRYCHVCGEKTVTPKDKSIKRWLGDLFSSIWMLEGKLFRSLKLLIFKPGQLAKDYVNGKRKPYVRLLNLFLIANLIYFLFPTFSIFINSLENQRYEMVYAPIVKYAVDEKLESMELDFQEYAAAYNEKTAEVSKLILIVLAPLLGFFIYVLFKKQGLFLSDCFGLALQFWAFFIFIFILLLPNLDALIEYFFNFSFLRGEINGEVLVTVLALVTTGTYLFFQMKSWQVKKWSYYGKIFILILTFLPILNIYRFILFWCTWLAL